MKHYISETKHNKCEIEIANSFAKSMYKKPSPLERRMQLFLDKNGIEYEFQKVIYILDKTGSIIKFFIADFYIPKGNVIIETDGKFHDNQKEYDDERTTSIKKHYPNIQVIIWRFNDFRSPMKMRKLLEQVA